MQVETTGARGGARQYQQVEIGWLTVAGAICYTGQNEYEIRKATEIDPLTGKPALEHVRIGGKNKIAFTRAMLDRWMMRGLRRAADDDPDMMKG